MEELILEILEELKIELSIYSEVHLKLLESKMHSAKREVERARKYPKYYTEEMIEEDLIDYISNIKSLVIYDFRHVGAEGELSHSEPGISRSFIERKECFAGIVPLCKF